MNKFRLAFVATLGFAAAGLLSSSCAQQPRVAERTPTETRVVSPSAEEAGRYLILMGGCNDCHTLGWEQSGGKMPESEWLTGSPVGYRGPWGTTYATNLRLYVQAVSEDEWVRMFRERNERPPMPWVNYRTIHESDLRAIYRFIRSLGPAGKPEPDYVPPDKEPMTPYLSFVPIMPANGGQ
ncbi:MAG: cytochrome C [Anaerolineae bacterium]|nr:hypothetical protein [Thermoflexales bacterium]MDW8395944.1 cytochrome C [Anaerolineae bacterium]